MKNIIDTLRALKKLSTDNSHVAVSISLTEYTGTHASAGEQFTVCSVHVNGRCASGDTTDMALIDLQRRLDNDYAAEAEDATSPVTDRDEI